MSQENILPVYIYFRLLNFILKLHNPTMKKSLNKGESRLTKLEKITSASSIFLKNSFLKNKLLRNCSNNVLLQWISNIKFYVLIFTVDIESMKYV